MHKFPVKIDLSIFFDDERRNVLILVDPKWENVENLQQRVEAIFDVKNVRFLSSDGYFLPPQEPIEVVKFVQLLKAFIPVEVLEEKKRKKLNKNSVGAATNVIIENDENVFMPPPAVSSSRFIESKRKFIVASSTPNQPKRAKSLTIAQDVLEKEVQKSKKQQQDKSNEITSTNAQLNAFSNSNLEPSTLIEKQMSAVLIEGAKQEEQQISFKRRKKHSKKEKNIEQCQFSSSDAYVDTSQYVRVDKENNSLNINLLEKAPWQTFKSNCTSKIHISYDESAENITRVNEVCPESKTPKTKVSFCCRLAEVDITKPRVFSLTPILKKKSKESVMIQEVILLKPAGNIPNDITQTEIAGKESPKKEIIEKDSISIKTMIAVKNITNASFGEEYENNSILKEKWENLVFAEKEDTCNESSIIAVDSIMEEKGEESKLESDLEEDIIDLNETEEEKNCENSNNVVSNSTSEMIMDEHSNEFTVEKILPLCTPLEKLPNIGDIIVFKMNYNDNTPKDSSLYLTGRCEYVNKRTKSIKLCLIDNQIKLECLPAKFRNNLDDSMDTKYINIKLTDMIDAKVLATK